MKRFMYLSIGVLCLSIAVLIGFQIGARNAVAQSPAPFNWMCVREGITTMQYVIMPNGDQYQQGALGSPANFVGNFFSGSSVGTVPSSLGSVKSNYSPKKP